MCNPAWHPIWREIASEARVRKGTVLAILHALIGEGDAANRLSARMIALDFGWQTDRVERVLAQFEARGITICAIVASEWRPNRTPDAKPDAPPTLASENRTLEPHANRPQRDFSTNSSSIRSRRKYWRDKERGAALSTASENRTPLEEKEEDNLILSDTSAGAHEATDNAPLGYQRKQGFVISVMRRAKAANMLSRDADAELWSGIMLMRPDPMILNWGLPRRTNDELDRLDKVLNDRSAPSQAQPSLMLPITGGATDPPKPQAQSPPRLSAEDILYRRDRRIAAAR